MSEGFELRDMGLASSSSSDADPTVGDNAAEPLIPRGHSQNGDDTGGYTARRRDGEGGSNYGEEEELGEEDRGVEDGEVDEGMLVTGGPGWFIWTLTFCAGVSGLLFGYDTGVISSTLISINTDLSSRPLTTLDKSLITSSTSLFALLASPLTGLLADSLGRKTIILIADLLFIIGALLQALTSSVWGMIAGRSIVGAAVGSASFVVPLYISEVSPSPFRGRLVTVASLFITGGQVVAYLVGWGFSGVQGGWRWMVGLGALPAAVQVLMMGSMPETPRWLVRAGRVDAARRVLMRVYGGGKNRTEDEEQDVRRLVAAVLRRVEREIVEEEDAVEGVQGVESEGKFGFRGRFKKMGDSFALLLDVGGNRRALVIACMLQGFQQLCGFVGAPFLNSLMYFSATIFSLVGFRSPTLTSLSIAITNFIMTLVAFHYIDRVGRRRILLLSIPIMIIGLALCSLAFNFLHLPQEKASSALPLTFLSNRQSDPADHPGPSFWALIILLAMVTYVAGYAVGMGNVPWQQSELFPLSVRALGSALATATNWASNFLIGITFLPMMEWLTPVGTFALYTVVCVVGWGVVWRIYPETAGLRLEDVGGLLGEGWGVKESVERWRIRRRRGG